MERSFIGLISGLNYNEYKILDMASEGHGSVEVTGDVRLLENPEKAIIASMPPMIIYTGTPTSRPDTNITPESSQEEPTPTTRVSWALFAFSCEFGLGIFFVVLLYLCVFQKHCLHKHACHS